MIKQPRWIDLKIQSVEAKHRGDLTSAIALRLEAIDEAKRMGASVDDIATSMNYLAFLYLENNQVDVAEKLGEEIIVYRRSNTSETNSLLITDYLFLTGVKERLGKFDEAIQAAERGLTISESQLGPDRFETIHARNKIESLKTASGRSLESGGDK